MNRVSKTKQILDYAKANPQAKPADIAKEMGVKIAYVYSVQWSAKKKAELKPKKAKLTLPKPSVFVQEQIELFDLVNHPAHYKVGGIETIDFIEAKKLGYNLGNVVKYLTRAEHKGNRKQDLEKAKWYLERELSATT
jgi:hypothetical protein